MQPCGSERSAKRRSTRQKRKALVTQTAPAGEAKKKICKASRSPWMFLYPLKFRIQEACSTLQVPKVCLPSRYSLTVQGVAGVGASAERQSEVGHIGSPKARTSVHRLGGHLFASLRGFAFCLCCFLLFTRCSDLFACHILLPVYRFGFLIVSFSALIFTQPAEA